MPECHPKRFFFFLVWYAAWMGFPGGSLAKNMPANAGDAGLIPGLGRSFWEGNGNPLQYSCLENPMDRGAWLATVHEVLDMTWWLGTQTHSLNTGTLKVFPGDSKMWQVLRSNEIVCWWREWNSFSFQKHFSDWALWPACLERWSILARRMMGAGRSLIEMTTQ